VAVFARTSHNGIRFKHIEIIFALEEELGVEFSEKQMAAISSVSTIADEVLALSAA
jgi:acyl carrier protein